LMGQCEIPWLNEQFARRSTESYLRGEHKHSEGIYNICYDVLALKWDPTLHRDYLRGIQAGLVGRRIVPMPKGAFWNEAYPLLIESPLPEVRERALALAVQFGDERAFTLLRKIVPDRAQPMKDRESALKTLLFQQKAD